MEYRECLNLFWQQMSEVCTVRALTEEYLPMVLAWRNHPAVRRYMFNQHEISLQEHHNWFESVKDDIARQQLIVFDCDVPIGFVQFNPVCQGGTAFWGFYVRPDAPKGSGTKLGQAALAYAFNKLGLYKVCGQAIEANMVSIGFHKKLGFAEEGRQREQQCIANQYHTILCFGLLAREWQKSQLKQNQTNGSN